MYAKTLCMLATLVKRNIYMLLQFSNSKLDMNPLSKIIFLNNPMACIFLGTEISLLTEQNNP